MAFCAITVIRTVAVIVLLLACHSQCLPRAEARHTETVPHGCPERCQEITISVFASAQNVVAPALGNLSEPGAVNALLAKAGTVNQTETESGTFNISARYCPIREAATGETSDVIELLIHGGSYTKDYWAGGNFPGFDGAEYSWIKYAERRNYATLSLDELGNGNSSHPDPAKVVQPALESETIHAIIGQLHAGKIGNKRYPKVVLIGHSFGSLTSARLAQNHPTDMAGLILTGYSHDLSGNIVLQNNFQYEPAFTVMPRRFSHLPQAYFAMSNESGRTHAFYYAGHYDPIISSLDFETEGTVPLGEPWGVTIDPVPAYTGPVLLCSGDHDAVVCGNNTGGSCLPADTSTVAASKNFFSNAESFTYVLANESGHAINFHYGAQRTFEAVHDWIDKKIRDLV